MSMNMNTNNLNIEDIRQTISDILNTNVGNVGNVETVSEISETKQISFVKFLLSVMEKFGNDSQETKEIFQQNQQLINAIKTIKNGDVNIDVLLKQDPKFRSTIIAGAISLEPKLISIFESLIMLLPKYDDEDFEDFVSKIFVYIFGTRSQEFIDSLKAIKNGDGETIKSILFCKAMSLC